MQRHPSPGEGVLVVVRDLHVGTLAWLGGVVAIAVYLMTLRGTNGGIAYDFLRRLATHQRSAGLPGEPGSQPGP